MVGTSNQSVPEMTIECPAIPLHMIHDNSLQGWSGPGPVASASHLTSRHRRSLWRDCSFTNFVSLSIQKRQAGRPSSHTRGYSGSISYLNQEAAGKKNGGKFRSIVYKPIRCLALNSPIFARTINWTHPQILEKETKPKTMPLVQSVFCTHHPAHKTLGWEPFFCLSWNWNLLATL